MRKRLTVIGIGVALWVSAVAHAGVNEWTKTTGSDWTSAGHRNLATEPHSDSASAIANFVASCTANYQAAFSSTRYCVLGTSAISFTGGNYRLVVTADLKEANGSHVGSDFRAGAYEFTVGPGCANWSTEWGGCEHPDSAACGASSGRQYGRWFPESSLNTAICTSYAGGESNVCAAVPVGQSACNGGLCYATVELTGAVCDGEDEPGIDERVETQPPEMNCITKGIASVCVARSDPNCGLVNGEPWCAQSLPPGGCISLGDGGVMCTSGSTYAPTELDGVTPATADAEFSVSGPGGELQIEFFLPATVAASGTPVATGGAGPGGSGTGPGTETPGPGECSEPGSCEGVLPSLGEVGTFAGITGAFITRVEAAPLVAATQGLAATMPAGVCPIAQFEVSDWGVFTIDAHCVIWEDVSGVLTWALLAVYVFIGARIVLSA